MKLNIPGKKLATLASVAMFSFGALTFMSMPGMAQSIPPKKASARDSNLSSIPVPFYQDGTLFLAQVKKPTVGQSQTTELSRQSIRNNIYRLADVNPLTGMFLYQTIDPRNQDDFAAITTWLGNANGETTSVLKGAGYVKLSPGGQYIAAVDREGTLHIVDRGGKELAVLGKASAAVFSPDGYRIAFFNTIPYSVGDARGISVVDLVSGQTIATYRPDGKAYFPLAFSADGSTLYFTTAAPLKQGQTYHQDENRVNVYALAIPSKNVTLITTGAQKLPYMDYRRVEYLAGASLLVLAAETTVWIVNTRTGNIQTFPNSLDVISVGSVTTLLVRPSAANIPDGTWNVLNPR